MSCGLGKQGGLTFGSETGNPAKLATLNLIDSLRLLQSVWNSDSNLGTLRNASELSHYTLAKVGVIFVHVLSS